MIDVCMVPGCIRTDVRVMRNHGEVIGPVCTEHEHRLMYKLAFSEPEGRDGYLSYCEMVGATPRLPLPPAGTRLAPSRLNPKEGR